MSRRPPELFTGKDLINLELEKDFQIRVEGLAHIYGWRVYTIPDSRRASLAGYPDLTLWRGSRLIFAELKREKGRVSPAQEQILAELKLTGAETYIWRPSHWDAIIETLKKGK